MSQDPPGRNAMGDIETSVNGYASEIHRLIVIGPGEGNSYLDSIYAVAGRAIPAALSRWEEDVDGWCDDYRKAFGTCAIVEINLGSSIYLFDRTHERVLLAYGLAIPPAQERDRNRMRGFPDVNVGIKTHLASDAFPADRGHFLSHSAGGELDINLFPHRRELNRGWSPEGKTFRRMERYVASHPGTFHAHRASYDDQTWIPAILEYRVLKDDATWWIEKFANK